MLLSDEFFLDIEKLRIAHKFTLDRVHKCEFPSGRGFYGLVYALSGRAEYIFSTGNRVTVTDGDVLFLTPHAAYSIITEAAFEHYTVNFDVHEDTSRFGPLDKSFCLLKGENTVQIKQCFAQLTRLWMSKKTGFEMQAVGCVYELLSLFCFDYINGRNTAHYQRLLPAKEHIEQCFDQPITLEQLAFLSNMSVTNFRREWKKQYTESPLRYRDNIRLCYAKEYLNSGYYTVSEIAEKCGFDDVSYFVRFFKKQTGTTPGEFRKGFFGK